MGAQPHGARRFVKPTAPRQRRHNLRISAQRIDDEAECAGQARSLLVLATAGTQLIAASDGKSGSAGRAAGGNDDGGRGRCRDADRPRARHHLRPAGRAERPAVRGAVQVLRPAAHGAHPPRTGRRLYGARRGAGDRQAAGLRGGAGAGPAQCRRRAAHRLCHQRSGARADRPNSRCRYRPRPRPAARDPRPGRNHQAAGRSRRAHPQAGAGVAGDGTRVARDAHRPARAGGARMRHRRLGQVRSGDAARAAAHSAAQRSTTTPCARRQSSLAAPSGR